jgi:hypothetical protein
MNLATLADLPGQWIDPVHRRRPRIVVLDMESSESPTYSDQEGSGLVVTEVSKVPIWKAFSINGLRHGVRSNLLIL